MDSKLSALLKSGTKKVHREAERVHFMKQFAKGKIERYWYRMLLNDLYYVYKALEEESERNKDDPLFQKIYFPEELHRRKHLEEDLAFYFGEDWEAEIEESAATKVYVERIRKLGAEDPFLLVAHHYTRYLGDLSGGQILKSVASKAMDLDADSGEGLRFFEFENVSDAKEFKNDYRAAIDSMAVSEERRNELVREGVDAFMFNIGLFKELDEWAGHVELEQDIEGESEDLLENTDNDVLDDHITEEVDKAKSFEMNRNTEETVEELGSDNLAMKRKVTSKPGGHNNVVAISLVVALVAAMYGIMVAIYTQIITGTMEIKRKFSE